MIEESLDAEKREILEADKREILDWLNEDDTPATTPSRQLDMPSIASYDSLGLSTPRSDDGPLFSPTPKSNNIHWEENDDEQRTKTSAIQINDDDDDELTYRADEKTDQTTAAVQEPMIQNEERDVSAKTMKEDSTPQVTPPVTESASPPLPPTEKSSSMLPDTTENNASEAKRNSWDLTAKFTKSLSEGAAKARASANSANELLLSAAMNSQVKIQSNFSLLARKSSSTLIKKNHTENTPERRSSDNLSEGDDEIRGVFSIGDDEDDDDDFDDESSDNTKKQEVIDEKNKETSFVSSSEKKTDPSANVSPLPSSDAETEKKEKKTLLTKLNSVKHQPAPTVDPAVLALAQHRIAGLQKGQEVTFDSKNLPDTVLFTCIKLKPMLSKSMGFNLGSLAEKKLLRCIGVNRERVLVFDTRGQATKFGVKAIVKSNHHLTELVKLTFPRAREPDVIAMHIRAGISPDAPVDQVALKSKIYKVPRAQQLIKALQDKLARFR